MIRVVVADDHSIVREGLRSLIDSSSDMVVVGEKEDGDSALECVLEVRPDVFLMDISMPGCSGLELIQAVRRRAPDTSVLVLSMHGEQQYAARVIRAGAQGFVTKSRPPAELLGALRQVARGQIYVTADLAREVALQALTGKAAESPHARLSTREYEVFIGLAKGHTVTQLAEKLHLSPKTVSTHKVRILRKLGVRGLPELVRYAIEQELI